MQVKVLLFAQLRRQAGSPEIALEVGDGATVAEVAQMVEARFGLSLRGAMAAVGERYATPETPVQAGDEIAFLPPVAGGSEPDLCLVSAEPLDLRQAERFLLRPEWGAQAYFVGTVRSPNRGKRVANIVYEAYAPMAEREMRAAAQEARERFGSGGAYIAHRTGQLGPGEASILIGVGSAHRRAALSACDFLIETLKARLPVWKLETNEDGSSWVEGNVSAPTLE